MPLQMQIIVVGSDDPFDFKNVNEGDSRGDSDDEPGLPGVTIYSDLNFNGTDEVQTFIDEYTSYEPTAELAEADRDLAFAYLVQVQDG